MLLLRDITSEIDLHNNRIEKEMQEEVCLSIKQSLKTPVNTVFAALEMVKEDVKELLITEQQAKYVANLFEVMNSSLCVVNTHISDYADYINLKNNAFNIVTTKFNVKEALTEILESYKLQASVRLLKFNIVWERALPPEIVSDKQRLQQILRNVVSNALSFTKTSIDIEIGFNMLKNAL